MQCRKGSGWGAIQTVVRLGLLEKGVWAETCWDKEEPSVVGARGMQQTFVAKVPGS